MANKVFSQNFENCYRKTDYYIGNFGTDHTIDVAYWIEGQSRTTPGFTPHSGTRCLGQETLGSDTRNEFIIWGYYGGGGNELYDLGIRDEIFIREWFYLPVDWDIAYNDWYQMFQITEYNPSRGTTYAWNPWNGFMMEDRVGSPAGYADIFMRSWYGPPYGVTDYQRKNNWQVPRGRWFKFEWWEKRHTTNGFVKCWIDDVLTIDVNDIPTSYPGNTQWYVETSKIYCWINNNYKLWMDDIEIWDGFPGPSVPPKALTVKSNVAGRAIPYTITKV